MGLPNGYGKNRVQAVDKIGKERELASFNEMYKHYYRLWSMHQPMFAERFWLDLLKQKIPANSETIKDILSKQNFPFTETATFLPVLISVQLWRKSLTLREQNIMEYALRNAAEELILKAEGQIVNMDAGNLLIILPSDERLSDLRVIEQDCRKYIDACARNFYCDLSCYIGKPVSIQEMREMVASLLAMEKDNVAWQSGVFHKATGQAIIHEHVDLPAMSGWAELLKQGSKDFLLVEVAACLDSLKKKPGLSAKLLQQFYQDFLQMIHYVLTVKGMQAHKIVSEYVTPERAASATRSIHNLQDELLPFRQNVQKSDEYEPARLP
ncbi:hypothetical protein [Paenibacillus sp. MBLB4367]|uniref:hypothetical protein n=1 Tax=Paenibacillus sp. MBLB4367 TaxID=3384767 RepID=UPI00390838BE